jgi:hypothetical protein
MSSMRLNPADLSREAVDVLAACRMDINTFGLRPASQLKSRLPSDEPRIYRWGSRTAQPDDQRRHPGFERLPIAHNGRRGVNCITFCSSRPNALRACALIEPVRGLSLYIWDIYGLFYVGARRRARYARCWIRDDTAVERLLIRPQPASSSIPPDLPSWYR